MVLDIRLAGFNVDKQGIDNAIKILKSENISEKEIEETIKELSNLTPETISASYARISRDARAIPELRADSRQDVEASRKSNKAIIFGMGHKSIAEHAIFNFDVMGLSRRAVEEIEEKRLQSYTEKSQRYITLDGDYVIPKEIQKTPLETKLVNLIEKQNKFYDANLDKLTKWHVNKIGEEFYQKLFVDFNISNNKERQLGVLAGFGKEDARYALAQATEAQLGMTVSARNLEGLITKLRSSPEKEFSEIGEKLFNEIDGVAPSVIKYIKPTDYFTKTRSDLKEYTKEIANKYSDLTKSAKPVEVFSDLGEDEAILAGLIFSSTKLDYNTALYAIKNMEAQDKMDLIEVADRYQEKHDPKLREYELGTRVTEFIMSSSAFAQIKRHRMNTLIPQQYNPELGIIIPPSITGTNLAEEFKNIQNESTQLYYEILKEGVSNKVADYALTNAHKRRILLDANNRQVHAIAAERMNLAAQWDIRNLVNAYVAELKKDNLTLSRACGKHEFYEVKNQF